MTLMDHDLGTPRPRTTSRDQVLQTVELTIDGQTISVEEGTSVMRAAALCGVDVPKTVCYRKPRPIWLVPFVLGRNRRTQGHASLVHHACYAWHVG